MRAVLFVSLSLVVACGRDPGRPTPGTSGGPSGASPAKLPAPLATTPLEPAAPQEKAELSNELSAPEIVTTSKFHLGELTDIGPAAPARAASEGIYVTTRSNRLLLAKRTGARFEVFTADAGEFSKYGRAPALTKSHAYWINPEGELLRADRKTLAIEFLTKGAHSGTRVSAATIDGRDVAAFIKDEGEFPRGYAWAEGGEIVRLSEDEGTATSVTLLQEGTKAHVLLLEGQLGMSSVHLRSLTVTKKRLNLARDEVIWVGPGTNSLTELGSLAGGTDGNLALLAAAKDVNHFGLAQIPLTKDAHVEKEPNWLPYPNGIDPAPAFAAKICGHVHIAYARPSDARPRSPQELRLAPYDGTHAEIGEVIARSRAFNDISLAEAPQGAVLSWTADRRTWALSLGCPKSSP